MLNAKTSMGIDISDGWIKIAALKKDNKGISISKTAQCPIPAQAIKNGNIEDPAALAKTIKELIVANKIKAKHTAVCAVAEPMLVQIMDIPKEHSINIGQYVRDEIKNYAILPMSNVAIDFCGLISSAKTASRRAMVVAMADEKAGDFAKTLCHSGLNLDSVEPAIVAYIRAFYAKKIAKRFDRNLLFTFIRDDELTFCLFKNQVLDFVQTKRIEKHILESDLCSKWLAEEINAVIGFYENEYPEDRDEWEVTLISSIFKNTADENTNALGVYMNGVTLNIVASNQTCLDTPATNADSYSDASAVAIGLAMKHLDCADSGLSINLLPDAVDEVKAAKKQAMVAFNIAAVILLLLILSIGILSASEKKLKQKLEVGKQQFMDQNAKTLLNEQNLLNKKIANISKKLEEMNDVMASERFLKWADILQDISLSVPKTVRITELSCDNSEIIIDGVAVSYSSINLFVDLLSNCQQIAQASATETRKDKQSDGLVNYSIKCSLAKGKG